MINRIDMPTELKEKQVVLYGAGAFCSKFYLICISLGIYPSVTVDMDTSKHGKYIFDMEIISPEALSKFPLDTPIIITTRFIESVESTLNGMGFTNLWCFSDLAYSSYAISGTSDYLDYSKVVTKRNY